MQYQIKEILVCFEKKFSLFPILIKNEKNYETIDDTDVLKATGANEQNQPLQLNRIYQLTGFSDPIYAEAYVNVHQYDIVLDVSVMNQTPETLQNLALELATIGDLKLVERPQTYTIGPHSKTSIKVNIKVNYILFYKKKLKS